ncbi:MAG: four-carbon acid sugar kinase family protein [Opitutaceae bacterium]
MQLSKSAAFAALPPIWPTDVLAANAASASGRTLVVLDDDPTGTQTVHDIAVVTTWDVATLTAELAAAPACFYILTNSRSLTPAATRALHLELATNLRSASLATGRAFVLASRSDSTLRGHYPLETDTLSSALGPFDVTLLTPYFEAGGRYTLNDTHYVAEGDRLVPAAETPFARDAAFGYRHSHLPSWVEEKTAGRTRAADVATISLNELRSGGPLAVAAKLRALPRGSVCIVNAAAPRDIEVFAAATLAAESTGSRFLYRTAAGFVAARLGQSPQHALLPPSAYFGPATFQSPTVGGLTLVGSYVPKTSAQLAALLATSAITSIELDVAALLDDTRRPATLAAAVAQTNTALAAGRDTVVFTSRQLITSSDATASLAIGRRVSDALIFLIQNLTVAPRYLIAKGGITSSDTATLGLGVRRVLVLGQALPGVPVWQLGPEAKFPGLGYVVFPGNVGSDTALADLVARLSRS